MAEARTGAGAPADAAKPVPACREFLNQMQSNPNPADAARSGLFSAGGQIVFGATAICPATIPGFRFFAGKGAQDTR